MTSVALSPGMAALVLFGGFFVMLVARVNVKGGESRVFDADGPAELVLHGLSTEPT